MINELVGKVFKIKDQRESVDGINKATLADGLYKTEARNDQTVIKVLALASGKAERSSFMRIPLIDDAK